MFSCCPAESIYILSWGWEETPSFWQIKLWKLDLQRNEICYRLILFSMRSSCLRCFPYQTWINCFSHQQKEILDEFLLWNLSKHCKKFYCLFCKRQDKVFGHWKIVKNCIYWSAGREGDCVKVTEKWSKLPSKTQLMTPGNITSAWPEA